MQPCAPLWNMLEVLDVTVARPTKVVLPRLPRKAGLHENTSPFLELRTDLYPLYCVCYFGRKPFAAKRAVSFKESKQTKSFHINRSLFI